MVCRVYVVGVGMGNPALLTLEAKEALRSSDLVVGSSRLLDALREYDARKVALVAADKISYELREAPERTASVVMSGDVGFYSGATRLYPLLEGMDVRAIPGVSSLSYMCARLRMPWDDVHVVSLHGRDHDAVGDIQCHAKTFVLLGGSESAGSLCARLVERGLGFVHVWVAQRLSYDDEHIVEGSAAELAGKSFERLCVMLALNDRHIRPEVAAPHLDDSAFVRGKVPMTKEEVRELAVCKLRVRPHDVVWDVGAGTGSVSVELARAAYAGQVLAIEKGDEALGLLKQNKERFCLCNLRIVAGEAPDVLASLAPPDRVFVGGSSGSLKQILHVAVAANPEVRICVAAITLETLSAVLASVGELGLEDVDICQVSIARAREVGAYHLMQAQNPVYLVTASGR